MLKIKRISRISTAVIVLALVACATAMVTPRAPSSAASLREGMRKLWADHVIWTRQYIVAAVGGDASASQAAARLLRNQEDIGNAILPFYGSAAGARLTELLKEHITIAVDLVAAAKAGNNQMVTDADRRWHRNAADIAAFLAGANPHWSQEALVSMLNEHLAMTTHEATARIQQRWADDVVAFDQIFEQAMTMADALSDGIIRQFPGRFGS